MWKGANLPGPLRRFAGWAGNGPRDPQTDGDDGKGRP
jgi:hypothetical protein